VRQRTGWVKEPSGAKKRKGDMMDITDREYAIQMLYILLMASRDLQELDEETREAIYRYYARQIGPALLRKEE
jgi:hypothetical protein